MTSRVTSRANGEPLVRLSGVNKWFGELHVLQDIDLEVARGEVVVVIGPSGSIRCAPAGCIHRLRYRFVIPRFGIRDLPPLVSGR